jgi:hypothetical protein
MSSLFNTSFVHLEEREMTQGVIRFIEEEGKLLAVVDPAAIGTTIDPTSFWQGLIVDFVKERSHRGIGTYYPLHIPPQDREASSQTLHQPQKDHS